jgi:FkbM family methyltransferase
MCLSDPGWLIGCCHSGSKRLSPARLLGLARSLAIYRGIPGRAARLRRFYRPFVSPSDLCFDIGAHVGNHSRCWRQLGARVVSVEPQPDFARLLRALYGRDQQITILEAAVGASTGVATLLASERTPTVSTMSRDWIEQVASDPGFARVAWTPGNEVPVTTLAELIARFGSPRFVKIDVEGFEIEVLRGLDRALPALSFEVMPATRDATIACIDRLTSLGEYQFNLSFGERYRFDLAQWCTPQAMRERVAALVGGSRSGDVYARLIAGRGAASD